MKTKEEIQNEIQHKVGKAGEAICKQLNNMGMNNGESIVTLLSLSLMLLTDNDPLKMETNPALKIVQSIVFTINNEVVRTKLLTQSQSSPSTSKKQ